MHSDVHSVDLIENTEDMSYRHASTNLPTTDAPKHVYHPPTSLYELEDRRLTRFDVSSDIDHQENDEDTSSRHVPSSFLPLAAGRRIMTSASVAEVHFSSVLPPFLENREPN